MLETATAHNVGVLNASINAALDDQDPERARQLAEWCQARDLDLSTLTLHFCLRDKRFASILIGYSRPVREAQNMKALTVEIDETVWAELARDFKIGR